MLGTTKTDFVILQHNVDGAIPQEYYRWPLVATAARSALDTRYRLLDYMYTTFHAASVDGTPVLKPLWFAYLQDTQTYGVDLQFFYGPSVLVSPVTKENAMSVVAYLPKDSSTIGRRLHLFRERARRSPSMRATRRFRYTSKAGRSCR
jgi:hypothetical protein